MKLHRLLPFFLLIAVSALAQVQAPVDTSRVDQIVAADMAEKHTPAVEIAIARDGRVVYSRPFGIVDLENDLHATTETLFRTGSIAKPITAVAALTLVDAGKLDLDAPVQTYCPSFPLKPWSITTRELLSHTSGIRHYREGEVESTRHYQSMSDGFAIFAGDPLLFEPGTNYSYSTYGYTVVGCVIEGASHQNYFDYLRQHVLEPAGMAHTAVDDVFEIVPHRARGYQKVDDHLKNAGLMDSSYKIPGGGLDTTAEDLVRLGSALMNANILKPATIGRNVDSFPAALHRSCSRRRSEVHLWFGLGNCSIERTQDRLAHWQPAGLQHGYGLSARRAFCSRCHDQHGRLQSDRYREQGPRIVRRSPHRTPQTLGTGPLMYTLPGRKGGFSGLGLVTATANAVSSARLASQQE